MQLNDRNFLTWLTLALIIASLWIFSSYLHYLLVGGVLALATSHIFTALVDALGRLKKVPFLSNNSEGIAAFFLTCGFLIVIFAPLLYFVSMTYDQASNVDLPHIRQTLIQMVDNAADFLGRFSILKGPIARLKEEGSSIISGPAFDVAINGFRGLVTGVGSFVGQIMWILIFYFLFNAYGKKILMFLAKLAPMTYEHEQYLYKECAGTVSVVFYGTLFNMIAQGLSFGVLMIWVGGYDALYLGVLAGFCSVIPIVGAALIYVPVVALELVEGNWVHVTVILSFAWLFMGFFVDNILRLIFIGFLKKMFGFDYTMNEILILLAILAGIASFGIWGLIIGPSVLALTFAAANLYSTGSDMRTEFIDKGETNTSENESEL